MRRSGPLVLCLLVLLLFGAALLRLVQIMLVQGEALAAEAAQQRTRVLEYYQYSRGDILDRYGRRFTGRLENCLVIFPAMVREKDRLAERLAPILGLSAREVAGHFSADAQPYILKTGLTADQARQVLDLGLPGVTSLALAVRYETAHPAVQLIGSCRWSGERWQGTSGLEQQYDRVLAGRQDDQLAAYVDADGQLTREDLYLLEQPARYQSLQLTLDLDYQQIAENAFTELGYGGACVILDPTNGDLLAAASVAGYDPYFWDPAPADAYLNKAFALYPPASTFKMLLTAAALNEGASLPDQGEEGFCCTGSYAFGEGSRVSCTAAPEGHGEMDLARALACSCNGYFVALGQSLGGPLLRDYAGRLGLTEQRLSGYALPGHVGQDYLDFADEVAADLANVSLGERGVMVSPLQEAVLLAAVANGGYRVTPRLVRQVQDQDGRVLEAVASEEPQRVLTSETAARLRKLLAGCVENGTAAAAVEPGATAGAKTGTSETGGVWCSGFAPAEQPRWVIVVHVDRGTAGGVEAAAVFRRVLAGLTGLEPVEPR